MSHDTLMPQPKKKTAKKINLKFLWLWLLILAVLIALFFILINFCQFKPWWLILLLFSDYLILLVINFLNQPALNKTQGLKIKFKKYSWLVFSLFLLIMPALVLIFCGGWAWWLWLLTVSLFLLTLAFYFIGLLSEDYWLVVIPLSLFLLLLFIIVQFKTAI